MLTEDRIRTLITELDEIARANRAEYERESAVFLHYGTDDYTEINIAEEAEALATALRFVVGDGDGPDVAYALADKDKTHPTILRQTLAAMLADA